MLVSPALEKTKHRGHVPKDTFVSGCCGPIAPLTATLPPAITSSTLQSRWGQRTSSLLSLYLTSYTVLSPGSHGACVLEKIYPTAVCSAGWFPVI